MKLKITARALRRIHQSAQAVQGLECFGILAAQAGDETVTEAVLLPAEVSATHAEAAPEAMVQCFTALRSEQLESRGIFHSHGLSGVFHSATDRATMDRLLPQMAAGCMRPLRTAWRAPVVTAQDTAEVPMADGRTRSFVLLGRAIPGTAARERVRWVSISYRFRAPGGPARAVIDEGRIRLEGDGVVITLGIPDGVELACRTEDNTPVSIASVYSIVVNGRGEQMAECLEAYEFNGVRFTRLAPCEIEVEDGPSHNERALVRKSARPLLAVSARQRNERRE